MKVSAIFSFCLVSVVLFIPACGSQLHIKSPKFTAKKLLDKDLIGAYVPTADTWRYIKDKGNYPDAKISIVLSKNGECRIENIPDWWLTHSGEPNGKFDSGSGKWWVDQNESTSWCYVSLSFMSTEGFNSQKHNGPFATSNILLVGEGPSYLLHLTVGDPDSGEAMQFEKVAEPKK